MSIFDEHYLFFFVLLFLISIITSVAMHAFVREGERERRRVSENLFICA